jgi:hypothetical protein
VGLLKLTLEAEFSCVKWSEVEILAISMEEGRTWRARPTGMCCCLFPPLNNDLELRPAAVKEPAALPRREGSAASTKPLDLLCSSMIGWGCDQISFRAVRFHTAASMKMTFFGDVAPCSLVEIYRRFRGVCCLHHQGHGPLKLM